MAFYLTLVFATIAIVTGPMMRPAAALLARCYIVIFLLLLSACTAPAERYRAIADTLGFKRYVISGTAFGHVSYRNPAWGRPGPLHVYLDGDGDLLLNARQLNPDPTPRKPLLLRLMAQDSAPSVYLGRPCYHGFSLTPPCTPRLWTSHRYGEEVLASLLAAVDQLLDDGDYQELVLIGHSGGGTLAMLLAARLPPTRAVITLAGNLDPDRWTAYHGYRPLTGSLNPARLPPLPDGIVQHHYAGGRDSNVPAEIVRAAIAHQPSRYTQFYTIADFSHGCCWATRWPEILKRLRLRL